VNRNEDQAITTDILSTSGNFSGKAEASIINSDDLRTPFSFDKQSNYLPVVKEAKFNGNKLSFTFPPHSFTQIKVGLNKK
jgi:alpha-N-arabinofuranosidase